MKRKRRKTAKRALGTPNYLDTSIADVLSGIKSPELSLEENYKSVQRALDDVQNDTLLNILDAVGGLAVQTGSSMMTSGDPTKTVGGSEASSEGFSGFLNSLFQKPKAAFGGEFGGPVEAEGNEFMTTQGGLGIDIEGPAHEQGGVDIVPPPGSKIFSDRIYIQKGDKKRKKDMVSFADYIANINKKKEAMLKKLEETPGDGITKNTIDRLTQTEEAAEQQLLEIQSIVNSAEDSAALPEDLMNDDGTLDRRKFGTALRNIFGDISLGDAISTYAMFDSASNQRSLARQSYYDAPTEVDPYRDYGRGVEGLFGSQTDQVNRQTERAMREGDELFANLSRTVGSSTSSPSVGRANLLAGYSKTLDSRDEARSRSQEALEEINRNRISTQLDIEKARAEGVTAYQENRAKDFGAFMSALSRAEESKKQALGYYGALSNHMRENRFRRNLIDSTSSNFTLGTNGIISFSPNADLTSSAGISSALEEFEANKMYLEYMGEEDWARMGRNAKVKFMTQNIGKN